MDLFYFMDNVVIARWEMIKLKCQNYLDFLWTIHHCRNPTLAKCGGEAQHLEKVRIWSPPRLPNV
jgi:hypothetical protein